MEKNTDFEQERTRLTRRAWRVTGGYAFVLLVLGTFVVFGEEGVLAFRNMSPNEVGDLLAGVAGPVAFIWLVYGYFLQGIAIRQQAQELSQNTQALQLQEEALRAQVSELNASVEQQRQLVEISRKQMEAELEALLVEREKQRIAAQPKFVFQGCGGARSDGKCTYSTVIKNMGNAATNVVFSFSPEIEYSSIKIVHAWDSAEEQRFKWRYHGGLAEVETVLRISYMDAMGVPGERTILLIPDKLSEWRMISFSEIA